jgi:hypothetical protein
MNIWTVLEVKSTTILWVAVIDGVRYRQADLTLDDFHG